MKEQGGKEVKCRIELRHIAMIFMATLCIIISMLCCVYLGIQLFRREIHEARMKSDEGAEYVVEIRPLHFEQVGYASYKSLDGVDDGSAFLDGKIDDKFEYQFVKDNTDLRDLLISLGISTEDGDGADALAISDEFYQSGSVIVLSMEDQGLNHFSVNKMTRDENSEITVIGKYSSNAETKDVYGSVVILAVENVQPKYLKLDFQAE